MEAIVVSLIFFLITAGIAFFPFALSLWGKGGENPNVFVLAGVLAMLAAVANVLLVYRRGKGRALPRILASLGLVLAMWMITYPIYQRQFCPVCFFTGGSHPVRLVAGVTLIAIGVIIFVLGWKMTGWGKPGNKFGITIEQTKK
jgi:hypothetical protein